MILQKVILVFAIACVLQSWQINLSHQTRVAGEDGLKAASATATADNVTLENKFYGIRPIDQTNPNLQQYLYCAGSQLTFGGENGKTQTFFFADYDQNSQFYIYSTGCNGFFSSDLGGDDDVSAQTQLHPEQLWYVHAQTQQTGSYQISDITQKRCLEMTESRLTKRLCSGSRSQLFYLTG